MDPSQTPLHTDRVIDIRAEEQAAAEALTALLTTGSPAMPQHTTDSPTSSPIPAMVKYRQKLCASPSSRCQRRHTFVDGQAVPSQPPLPELLVSVGSCMVAGKSVHMFQREGEAVVSVSEVNRQLLRRQKSVLLAVLNRWNVKQWQLSGQEYDLLKEKKAFPFNCKNKMLILWKDAEDLVKYIHMERSKRPAFDLSKRLTRFDKKGTVCVSLDEIAQVLTWNVTHEDLTEFAEDYPKLSMNKREKDLMMEKVGCKAALCGILIPESSLSDVQTQYKSLMKQSCSAEGLPVDASSDTVPIEAKRCGTLPSGKPSPKAHGKNKKSVSDKGLKIKTKEPSKSPAKCNKCKEAADGVGSEGKGRVKCNPFDVSSGHVSERDGALVLQPACNTELAEHTSRSMGGTGVMTCVGQSWTEAAVTNEMSQQHIDPKSSSKSSDDVPSIQSFPRDIDDLQGTGTFNKGSTEVINNSVTVCKFKGYSSEAKQKTDLKVKSDSGIILKSHAMPFSGLNDPCGVKASDKVASDSKIVMHTTVDKAISYLSRKLTNRSDKPRDHLPDAPPGANEESYIVDTSRQAGVEVNDDLSDSEVGGCQLEKNRLKTTAYTGDHDTTKVYDRLKRTEAICGFWAQTRKKNEERCVHSQRRTLPSKHAGKHSPKLVRDCGGLRHRRQPMKQRAAFKTAQKFVRLAKKMSTLCNTADQHDHTYIKSVRTKPSVAEGQVSSSTQTVLTLMTYETHTQLASQVKQANGRHVEQAVGERSGSLGLSRDHQESISSYYKGKQEGISQPHTVLTTDKEVETREMSTGQPMYFGSLCSVKEVRKNPGMAMESRIYFQGDRSVHWFKPGGLIVQLGKHELHCFQRNGRRFVSLAQIASKLSRGDFKKFQMNLKQSTVKHWTALKREHKLLEQWNVSAEGAKVNEVLIEEKEAKMLYARCFGAGTTESVCQEFVCFRREGENVVSLAQLDKCITAFQSLQCKVNDIRRWTMTVPKKWTLTCVELKLLKKLQIVDEGIHVSSRHKMLIRVQDAQLLYDYTKLPVNKQEAFAKKHWSRCDIRQQKPKVKAKRKVCIAKAEISLTSNQCQTSRKRVASDSKSVEQKSKRNKVVQAATCGSEVPSNTGNNKEGQVPRHLTMTESTRVASETDSWQPTIVSVVSCPPHVYVGLGETGNQRACPIERNFCDGLKSVTGDGLPAAGFESLCDMNRGTSPSEANIQETNKQKKEKERASLKTHNNQETTLGGGKRQGTNLSDNEKQVILARDCISQETSVDETHNRKSSENQESSLKRHENKGTRLSDNKKQGSSQKKTTKQGTSLRENNAVSKPCERSQSMGRDSTSAVQSPAAGSSEPGLKDRIQKENESNDFSEEPKKYDFVLEGKQETEEEDEWYGEEDVSSDLASSSDESGPEWYIGYTEDAVRGYVMLPLSAGLDTTQ